MERESRYKDASLRAQESISNKIKTQLNKSATDSGLRLLKLISVIPNWETYLTAKQLEVARKYVKCMSAYEVDHQLKLSYGTTQQRLFGNNKTSKGALGRLEEVAKLLEETGYFEKLRKRQEQLKQQQKQKVSTVSDEVLAKTRELIKLAVEMPDYEKHLTKSQAEKLFQFLRLRSFKAVANHFDITESTLRQSLLGRTGQDGALGKLKKAYEQRTVNSWDEI